MVFISRDFIPYICSTWFAFFKFQLMLSQNPNHPVQICMPAGVRFLRGGKSVCPDPVFHSFVITREDGSQKYGGCLTYWTEVACPQILNSMQVQHNMQRSIILPKFHVHCSTEYSVYRVFLATTCLKVRCGCFRVSIEVQNFAKFPWNEFKLITIIALRKLI